MELPPRTLSDAFAAGLNQQAPDQVPPHLLGPPNQYGTPSPQAADLGARAASSPVGPAHRFADQAPTLHAGALDDFLGTVKGWFGIGPSITYQLPVRKADGSSYKLDVTVTPQHFRNMIIKDLGSNGEEFIAMAADLHTVLVSWPKLLMEVLGDKIDTAERQKLEALMQNKYHQAITENSPSALRSRTIINPEERNALALFSEDLREFIQSKENKHLATITQLFFGLDSIRRYLLKNNHILRALDMKPNSKKEKLVQLFLAYDKLMEELAVKVAVGKI